MARDITKNLKLAEQFFRVFREGGAEKLDAALADYADSMLRQFPDDPRAVDVRFTAALSGILLMLHADQPETLVKRMIIHSERFTAADSPERKAEAFRLAVREYLEQARAEADTFSRQAVYHLKTITLDELARLTIETWADRFGYHRNYFTTKFKKETGRLPHDAIIDERLSRAWALLKDSRMRMTVKEICALVGFSDTVYFSRIFRKRYGLNPSETPPGSPARGDR